MTGSDVTRPLPPVWVLFGAGSVLVAGAGIGTLPEIVARLFGPPVLVLLYRIHPLRAVYAAGTGLLILLVVAKSIAPVFTVALPIGLCGLILARGIFRGFSPLRVIAEATLPFLVVSLPFFFQPLAQEARALEVERAVGTSLDLYRSLGEDDATLRVMEETMREMAGAVVMVEPATQMLILSGVTVLLYGLTTIVLGRYGITVRRVAPFRAWRVPFGLVWIFAAGLAGVLSGVSPWREIGANLLLFMTVVYLVQGFGVLAWQFKKRRIPFLIQLVFLAVAVFLVFPVFAILTIGTGLIDVWVDIRRLERGRKDPQSRQESEEQD